MIKRFESFRLGEGLVGQCALEQKPILLNDVPHDYLKIRSGIGESIPASSMIFPILYEGETLAVVEIASFETFQRWSCKASQGSGWYAWHHD